MHDKLPRKLPQLDSFAGFDVDPRRPSGRRRARWAINPLRDEAMASADAARFSHLEGELCAGLGRKPVKE